MSAVSTLESELKNLSVLTKRSSHEVSTACDAALASLQRAKQANPDPPAVLASLAQDSSVSTPLVMCLSEANAKSCASALQCVQILAQYRAIAPSALAPVLQGLMQATKLGLGIQLKILQVVPTLLYNFSSTLDSSLIKDLVNVNAELLGSSKVSIVHNAACATFQQVVTGVLDRIDLNDDLNSPERTISVNNQEFAVSAHLYDATALLADICDLMDRETPSSFSLPPLSLVFCLELLELAVSNQSHVFTHPPLLLLLQTRVVPLLLRVFAGELAFPVVLRVCRLFYLLLRTELPGLQTEIEVLVSVLLQNIDRGKLWKQVLALEVLQNVCSQEELLIKVYSLYDASQRPSLIKMLVEQFTAVFVANKQFVLASEIDDREYALATADSSVSEHSADTNQGNGNNTGSAGSSSTANSSFASLFATNPAQSASSPDQPSSPTFNATNASNHANTSSSQAGFSNHLILTRNCLQQPVIESLDRVEPPQASLGYKYLLILKSLTALVENLHKLVNSPQKLAAKHILTEVSASLQLFHSFSLSLALDTELYKALIRSAQRLAHCSGILGLKSLRDEFMTLISQYCRVPDDLDTKRWLVQRCSLAVRALFTLGYALGNQLQTSWSLIAQTIVALAKQIPKTCDSDLNNVFGTEIPLFNTINMTLTRLINNTANLKPAALLSFMRALAPATEEVQFTVLDSLVRVNAAKFGDLDTECWKTYADIMLEGCEQGKNALDCAKTLNGSIVYMFQLTTSSLGESSTDLTSTQTEPADSGDVASTQAISTETELTTQLGMYLHTLCQEIDVSTSEVRILAVNDLNALLEKYGAYIKQGWADIFASIKPVPNSKNLELMRYAFHTLELITNDFLDSIPFSCFFSLTSGLDEFSRQLEDLNISFTSTSLLWHVCDFLMSENGTTPEPSTATATATSTLDDVDDRELEKVHNEDELIALACSDSSQSRPALWLLALLKLTGIAKLVPQQQVRTSAIQIFLRLYNQNGTKVSKSVWELSFALVFPALVDACQQNRDKKREEDEETLTIVVNGVTQLMNQYAPVFPECKSFPQFWEQYIPFLDWAISRSPVVANAVFSNLKSLLKPSPETAYAYLEPSIAKLWQSQSFLPSYSQDSPKSTADSLQSLVSMYPLLTTFNKAQALKLVGKCAAFPYYTALIGKMSALQTECVEIISTFLPDKDLTSDLLTLLCELALTPYSAPPKQQFEGLALWALEQLGSLVNASLEISSSVLEKVPYLFFSMTTVLKNSHYTLAAQIYVRMFELCPVNVDLDLSTLPTAFQLLLTTPNESGKQSMTLLQELITAMCAKYTDQPDFIPKQTWDTIISMLLEFSLFYDRSTLNLQYYQDHSANKDLILQQGTVELPRILHRDELACFCLSQLLELSKQTGTFYAPAAHKYYTMRVRAVLLQYMGDRKLQGREPMRKILELELMFILRQLESGESTEFVDIVADCLPRGNHDVLSCLQRILK